MSARLSIPQIVTLANAGVHHLSHPLASTVRGMGSRIRGNDEVEKVWAVQ